MYVTRNVSVRDQMPGVLPKYSEFQLTGMIEWGQKLASYADILLARHAIFLSKARQKSKPKKNPQGFQQNPKKSLDQKLERLQNTRPRLRYIKLLLPWSRSHEVIH